MDPEATCVSLESLEHWQSCCGAVAEQMASAMVHQLRTGREIDFACRVRAWDLATEVVGLGCMSQLDSWVADLEVVVLGEVHGHRLETSVALVRDQQETSVSCADHRRGT